MEAVLEVLSPLQAVSKRTFTMLIAGTIAIVAAFWVFSPIAILPSPPQVWRAYLDLKSNGLIYNLIVSYTLLAEAIGLATAISLAISYLSVIPALRPIIRAIAALRYLSTTGLVLAFEIAVKQPHWVKIWVLVFMVSVWFIPAMLDIIETIPRDQFDLARTLRMGRWRTVYEVIALGTADKIFDVVRSTAAMGWMMLPLVESIVFSEGGVGTVLQNLEHRGMIDYIMAVQLCVLAVGMAQDYLLGLLKRWLCAYAFLTVEAH